jgi:apolipoprotein N-acyltransferase
MQRVWDSPWGKIGICICYDLSYTRVFQPLIQQGAGAIIVPTMDMEYWGKQEHQLHARIAPVRAAESGVPIFRLASSGISQLIAADGNEIASAPFEGNGAIISGEITASIGELALDRFLAPMAVVVTGVFMVWIGARDEQLLKIFFGRKREERCARK